MLQGDRQIPVLVWIWRSSLAPASDSGKQCYTRF